MIAKPTHVAGNRLLASLSPFMHAAFIAESEIVHLREGDALVDPDVLIQHVVFPVTCVLATLSVLPDRTAVETAVTGYEGVAPVAVMNGVNAIPEHIITLMPGEARRVGIPLFRRAIAEDAAFRELLQRYSVALFTLTAQTAGCNQRHSVVQRCARWLLRTHDRVVGDEFPLTHLFLSQLLGVRRSSVTVAAEALRSAGAITYTRGTVRIVNREILESCACQCYSVVRAMFDRMLGIGATPNPLAGVRMSLNGRTLIGTSHQEPVLSV